jgi:signal transduction histidine kinase
VIVESHQVLVRGEQERPCAILEINRDVTERRRLERVEQEARTQQEARLHTLQVILDEMPTGALLLRGVQARLLFANRAATRLWGAEWKPNQSMEDFLTQHGLRLFSADGQPLPLSETVTRRAMVAGETTYHCQQVIRRADDTSLPILVSAIPLDTLLPSLCLPSAETFVPTPSERVVLVVYEDVTALKEAEALKDQFISLATHELRTPVTVVAGYTDMLLKRAARGKEHELDAWQSAKLQEMKQAIQQLTGLTQDLLDVTRVQAGQFQLHLHPTDLVAFTRQVVERLQMTTEHHQLSLDTALTHLWARVDAERVEQVLGNLLSNAIKYSPQGGPVEVTLEEDTGAHEARFRVRDHGMGIPRTQQAHLFGLFVRANNVRAARIGGTGLGLYLCRELVERHGGHIWFESEEGVGSTFFFSLPCTEAVQQEKGNAHHERTDSA